MNPLSHSNACSPWPPWPMARAFARLRTPAAVKFAAAAIARHATLRALRHLDQLDDRLLADIGLDRASLADLMHAVTLPTPANRPTRPISASQHAKEQRDEH